MGVLLGISAPAEPWHDIEPGVTTRAQVIEKFGQPIKQLQIGADSEVLVYQGEASLEIRVAQISVAHPRNVVSRVVIEPRYPVTEAEIAAHYGGVCRRGGEALRCYTPSLGPSHNRIWQYSGLGLRVVFRKGTHEAQLLVFETALQPKGPTEPAATPSLGTLPIEGEPSGASPSPGTDTLATGAGKENSSSATDAERAQELTKLKDPLQIGGVFFQQLELDVLAGSNGRIAPSAPSLLDVYLDANPAEFARIFALARTTFDPANVGTSIPQVMLSQLWLRLDIASKVFITIGRQQIKWGVSKIWNPTDFLRIPRPNPFDVFDLRPGVDMLKVTFPLESLGANLYAIGFGDTLGPATNPIRLGTAARAEIAVGTGEIGASAVFQEQRKPRYGVDASIGLGRFDLHGELALFHDYDLTLWQRDSTGTYTPRQPVGAQVMTSVGVSGEFRVGEAMNIFPALEGFYNQLGYADPSFLSQLALTNTYRPLYFGQFYAAAQMMAVLRGATEPQFIATLVSNLQHSSYFSRFEVNSNLRPGMLVNVFVEIPFGAVGTEFRFIPGAPASGAQTSTYPAFRTGASIQIRY